MANIYTNNITGTDDIIPFGPRSKKYKYKLWLQSGSSPVQINVYSDDGQSYTLDEATTLQKSVSGVLYGYGIRLVVGLGSTGHYNIVEFDNFND